MSRNRIFNAVIIVAVIGMMIVFGYMIYSCSTGGSSGQMHCGQMSSCTGMGTTCLPVMIVGAILFIICFVAVMSKCGGMPWRMCGMFTGNSSYREGPRDILKRRLASGDITKEDFGVLLKMVADKE